MIKCLQISLILLFASASSGYAQLQAAFVYEGSLVQKADSALTMDNYLLAEELYKKHLLDFTKYSNRLNEIIGLDYLSLTEALLYQSKNKEALTSLDRFIFYSLLDKKEAGLIAWRLSTEEYSLVEKIISLEGIRTLFNKYLPQIESDFILKKEYSYQELINYLDYLSKNNPENYIHEIYLKNKIIYWKKDGDNFIFNSKTKTLPFPNYKILKDWSLNFINVVFKMNLILSDDKNKLQLFPYNLFNFSGCTFEGRVALHNLKLNYPTTFQNCDFRDILYIDQTGEGNFAIDSSRIQTVHLFQKRDSKGSIFLLNNTSTDSAEIWISGNALERLEIKGNQLPKTDLVLKNTSADFLLIEENNFNNLILNNYSVKSEFDFLNNKINDHVLFNKSYFEDGPLNDISWKPMDNFKLGFIISGYTGDFMRDFIFNFDDSTFQNAYDINTHWLDPTPDILVDGTRAGDVQDENSFTRLIGLYSTFLNLYKNKNDLESYNRCFIAIKELRSARLKHLHESNPTFQNYFSWKLSQLLKFYVNHGTEPARAIVISLYIIIGFGIFFFFFPSDWDTTSKGNLFRNFRDFVEKNEKGYFKPFLRLAGGFALSLANALTLSLNAFITLGFGNIPTKGLARYICVLEGFMGWFLLSIFTVALINQVL